ncbi:hypothetical protein CKN86_02240 [Carnobacterium divergens]|uniref:hypothetical protein n=1 Tax=Carnobacterium divergens TaxID=2748 RepID=UPI000D418D41|nr:hypothetical protein [Carnobacterium divergens]MCO6018265.1 hypothetical protein [Carnobacterium divergens]TFI64607.1 hypothetical protein CKN62_02240 [Carnobacterium divergens]TFI91476.1 hypothetical protein CKN84_02240 [Carnobacterium divergens]TFJ06532.1 hypothetical protein CKN86_02240 [Carnobacterium divergens]TFJ07885.1 hypothetical protein CKN65_02245 [Carnobacterium divergens]
MSNLIDFREYIEEQKNLSFGVELGGTPAIVGSVAREYDFILESIDVYLEQVKEEHTLNENQQIVLDWLKAYANSDDGDKPISSIWYMMHLIGEDLLEKRVKYAYFKLTVKQQFEVLQVFAEWGLGHERN